MALSKTTTEPLASNPVDLDPEQAAEQFKFHLGYLQELLQGVNRQAMIDFLTQDASATPFQRRMLMELLDGVHTTGPANRDELTGMLTRSSLLDRFSQKNLSARHKKTALTLYFIDLDGFKHINDQHGHAMGDRVLTAVGARIQSAIRPTDMAVRWGGDEFIVVFEGVREPEMVIQLAARLLRIITAPLHLSAEQSIELILGASIGIAIGADVNSSIGDLIDQADRAMYQAKKSGKNSIHIFP
jgi:diguanylate cyclase (GGDEF)-like protein